MPEFTKRIREFLLTFVRIMMCLMVILFQLVIGQVNFRYSRWSKTALTGVSFMGHKSEFQNTSVMGCAAHCVENSPCLSFSVHRSSASCFIFSERVMFGINMTLAEGFVHYWRLSDVCPAGYSYDPSVNLCYKHVATPQLTWQNASLACQRSGGLLYMSNTEVKRTWLFEYIIKNGLNNTEMKLGGNDLHTEGTWAWLDGSIVTSWYTGQPDNMYNNQNCMENTRSHPYHNSDGVCNDTNRYMCEIPLH